MDGKPVTCPLCGAVVADAPDPNGAGDLRSLERHLAEGCPSTEALAPRG